MINLKHYSKIVSLYCGSIVKPNELNWFDDTEIDLENDEHAKRYHVRLEKPESIPRFKSH